MSHPWGPDHVYHKIGRSYRMLNEAKGQSDKGKITAWQPE